MSPGVDTIRLFLPPGSFEVHLAEGSKLIENRHIDIGTGEIKPSTYYYRDNLVLIQIGQPGLKMEVFSAPRLAGRDDNHIPADAADLRVCKVRLERLLKDLGVVTPRLDQSHVSRLDIAKNFKTDFSFGYYRQVFEQMHLPHYEPYFEGTTFRLSTRQIQHVFYDKARQLRNIYGIDLGGQNLMRAELRLLQKRSVNRAGIDTLAEVAEDFGTLSYIYSTHMGRLFSQEPRSRAVEDLTAAKMRLIEEKGVEKALKIIGAYEVSQIDRPTLRELLRTRTSQDYASRQSKRIRNLAAEYHDYFGTLGSIYCLLATELSLRVLGETYEDRD